MATRTFTAQATSTIALVVGLLFLVAAPITFLQVRARSEATALTALQAYGETVASEQEQRFAKLREIEARASAAMRASLAAPRPDAAAMVARDFPQQPDGTRRSRPALFAGEIRSDGSLVEGIGAFIPGGANLPPERLRRLVAAYDTLRMLAPGMRPELSNLYFYTPDNDILIYGPLRQDRLLFYRAKAPATLDFQGSNVARLATPAANPARTLRCTDLEPANYDPSGRTWTTGCVLPFDVSGRHVGAWGVSIALDELPVEGIRKGLPNATTLIVSRAGRVIYDARLASGDRAAAAPSLDLGASPDPDLRALWTFLRQSREKAGGDRHFQGYVAALGAYVAVNPVATPDWDVITFFPRRIVLAQSVRSAQTILLVGLLSVLATVLLLRQFLRRTVGVPLLALADRSEAIAALSGQAVPVLPGEPGVPEEVARLNANFAAMESAIRAERDRLTRSFDLLAQNVENYALYMLDPGGVIANWNRGAERITGYAAAEALGMPVDLLADAGDDAADPGAMRNLALQQGRAFAEGWRRRRDGSRFWAAVLTEAIHDEDGALAGFAEIMRDTTEERERQLQVAESLRLLTLAEDMAEIGHWRFRIGEDTVSWSPGCYRIHGLTLGMPVTMAIVMGYYTPAGAGSVTTMIERLIGQRSGETLVTEIIRADGATRRVAIQSLPEYGASGEVEAIFGVMRDITEAHEATARLTAAREAADAAAADRAQLLATMSHEIRTPMTGIIGMLDLLGQGGGSIPADISVAGIARSARTMMVILDDVLEHSRLDSNAVQLEMVAFDLVALIDQTAQLFRPLAQTKALSLTVAAPETLPVTGDPARVQQILSNLIGNAVKFTAQGGVAIACARDAAGMIVLTITDTGIGVAADAVPTLFDAWRQADAGIARRHGGSGLGLSICRKLAEAMGGTIAVESIAGQGSRFTLSLPLPAATLADDSAVPAALVTAAGTPPHLLVVEDTETTRQIVVAQLALLGATTAVAGNGVAALSLLALGDFDAVLMDSQMPRLDGVAATRLARLLPGPAGRVPIIGFTAGNVLGSEALRQAGADAVLGKPFDRARLAAVLVPLLAAPRAVDDTDPVAALTALFAALPPSARLRLAASAGKDIGLQGVAIAAALASGDVAAARTGLHALKGVAQTLGDAALAGLCACGEASLEQIAPADCGWLADRLAGAIAAATARIAVWQEPRP